MIDTISTKKIYWSYTVYGDNYSKYYEPVILDIELAIRLNVNVIISTTDKFERQIKFFFREYLDYINIVVFSSLVYTKREKILRYIVLNGIDYDYVFIKDSDSVTSIRELFIMVNWINLNSKSCLIIRDHELHISPILAGMFGFNKSIGSFIINNCILFFDKFEINKYNSYNYDQIWLARNIYPVVSDKSLVYTRFFLFSGEKYARIPKNFFNQNHFIGAQKFVEVSSNNQDNFLKFYKQDLLSIPYFRFLPFALFNSIYNRVRPTIYLSYVFSKILRFFVK